MSWRLCLYLDGGSLNVRVYLTAARYGWSISIMNTLYRTSQFVRIHMSPHFVTRHAAGSPHSVYDCLEKSQYKLCYRVIIQRKILFIS